MKVRGELMENIDVRDLREKRIESTILKIYDSIEGENPVELEDSFFNTYNRFSDKERISFESSYVKSFKDNPVVTEYSYIINQIDSSLNSKKSLSDEELSNAKKALVMIEVKAGIEVGFLDSLREIAMEIKEDQDKVEKGKKKGR